MSTQGTLLDELISELEDIQHKTEKLSQEVEETAKKAFILGYKQAQADAQAAAKGEPTNQAWEEAKLELGISND